MTVALQSPIVSYIGNGISTIYTYPFYLLEASHMQVYKNGALQSPATYTLTSVGNPSGGEVIFSVAPTLGEVVILKRVVPATQLVDYHPFDAFPADTHERALDKLTMLVQDGFLTDTNSVRAPALEPSGQASLVLPSIPSRANFLLGFDPNGNVAMFPQQGQEEPVTTAHSSLTGLSANDHPQYLLVADAFGTYLPKSGGTMTGPLTLMTGFPGGAFDAVPKSYVDAFIGTVITKNITSNAFGDAEVTVQQAWNSQATVGGITRASNEIIYYRWPSTGTVIYRYTGQQQGPINWTTVASDWVAASGVAEAPLDLKTYGRNNAAWVEVLPKTGGVFTGPIESNGFTTHGNIQINGDGVVTGSWSAASLAVAGNTTIGGSLSCGPITSPQINVTGPLLHADGTLAAPGIAWVNDPATGFRRDTVTGGVFCSQGTVPVFEAIYNAFNVKVPTNITGNVGMTGNVNITGPLQATGNLTIGGNAAIAGRLDANHIVLPNQSAGGALYINNAAGSPNSTLSANSSNQFTLGNSGWGRVYLSVGGSNYIFDPSLLNIPSGVTMFNGTQFFFKNSGNTADWEALHASGSTFHVARLNWTTTTIYGGGQSLIINGSGVTCGSINASGGTISNCNINTGGSITGGNVVSNGDGTAFGRFYADDGTSHPHFTDCSHQLSANRDGWFTLGVRNGGGNGNGIQVWHPSMGDNQTLEFFRGVNWNGTRIAIWSNSGIYNNQAANISWSDANVKQNIVASPDYTAFVEQLKFRRFQFISDPTYETDDVVAQELMELDDTLVSAQTPDGTMGVYTHRLQQRINSVIPKLIARIKALEARL